MTEYLEIEDLVAIGDGIIPGYQVRDWGLLEAAVARPAASAHGDDAYPTPHDKAAALLHSIVRNHALVDGNKRLGWAATVLFYALNGCWIPEAEDEQYDFVIAVADGTVVEIEQMAKTLSGWVVPLS